MGALQRHEISKAGRCTTGGGEGEGSRGWFQVPLRGDLGGEDLILGSD